MQISVELPPDVEVEEGMAFLKEEVKRRLGDLKCPVHKDAGTFRAGQVEGRAYRWRFHVCCEAFVEKIKGAFADVEAETLRHFGERDE